MTFLQKTRGKFLVRKERWTLTLLGKALVAVVVIVAAAGTLRGLFPFLAISCPRREGIMVVEGWIHVNAIPQVAREYAASHYRHLVVVNAVYDTGNKWVSGRYQGEYLTNALTQLGVPPEGLALVTCNVVHKDRTYHSALAVKKWMQQQDVPAKSFDIVTLGPHARRSRILFKRAFGPDANIGVIALDEHGYDPVHWWRSSEGVREVLFEGVAYLYVRLFFNPDDANQPES